VLFRRATLLATIGLAVPVVIAPAVDAGGPRFDAHVFPVSSAQLPYSYRTGCPVGPSELRLVRLRYWGFDGRTHPGTLVVNHTVVQAVVKAFATLYAERFPIRRMQPIDAYHGSDEASMAADNTSGFNCRYAVAPGPPHWSAHAYGVAIDVNPVENPYLEGGIVHPRAGGRYLDRTHYRPGMAVPNGQLVNAFLAAGWYWGGRWTASPDYQHFSATGN
jgi:D-alanyl-D-alanine carboxypeptidase